MPVRITHEAVTSHIIYKASESVLSLWLTLAHSGELHIQSSKDISTVFIYNLSCPPVYILARLSSRIFRRKWVPWMVDAGFLTFFIINYAFVLIFIISGIDGLDALEEAISQPQLTKLWQSMVILRALATVAMMALLSMDVVGVIRSRDKKRKFDQ